MNFLNQKFSANLSSSSPERFLKYFSLFCGVLLILIWPIAGTIALRNFLLIFGCLTGLIWSYFFKPKINSSLALLITCLLVVPVWLWIHYFMMPTDPAAQLYDLKGTWFRVVLAIVMGGSLGLMIAKDQRMILAVWFAMIALALLTFGGYLFAIWREQQLMVVDFTFPFKYKSAVVYFVMYPCLLAYSLTHYYISEHNLDPRKNFQNVRLGLIACGLAALCWLDFLASRALNGVLMASVMGFILLFITFKYSLLKSKVVGNRFTWVIFASVFLVLLVSIGIFWKYDVKHGQKLKNLVGDIEVAAQIDAEGGWRNDPAYKGQLTPKRADGKLVHPSTNERIAWFVKGFRLLYEHPLGAGFSHLAFRYFMLQENSNLGLYKTHSGWMDYALGLGLPGLLLTWIGIALACRQALVSLKNKESNRSIALSTLWILAGIWLVWWSTELSEREFIEHLFFMIALLGGANTTVSDTP